jgi:DNA-binding PadR family transcriptional regulator
LEEIINNLKVELKRGTIILIVLHFLKNKVYGYSLLQDLSLYSVPIEAGTLYPLLRRLEKQELLSSDWDTSDARPRKYYYLNDKGLLVYQALKKEWENTSSQLNQILTMEEKENGTY